MAKKKYSINWENGEAVSFEINGVVYEHLEDIPGRRDMQKMMAMMSAAEDSDFVDETAAPQKEAYPIENIILTIFSGVAGLMLLIALISAGSAISTMMKEKAAPGKVVDVVFRRVYVNEADRIIEEYYYPVVEFTADDGRRRAVQMTIGSNRAEYEIGDEVTVLYDPERPLDARIKSFGSAGMMWILPGITGILGIAFLGAVLLTRRVISAEENASQAASE